MKLALTPVEAAASLSVSRSFFDSDIKPQLKLVYVGSRILVPITSLERWLETRSV